MNGFGIAGIAWIVFCVTLVISDLGEYICRKEILVDKNFVFMMLFTVGFPFICGYLDRLYSNKKKD